MRSNYLGGVNALGWRKRVAATADKKSGETVHNRTFKFPLEIVGDLSALLPRAEELYTVVEGTDEGSLTALVFAVHLSGFRLFGAEREAKAFEDRKWFPDGEFAKVAGRVLNNPPKRFCPSEIYLSLGKTPRKEKADWKVEAIRDKLRSDLLGNDKKDEQKIDAVIDGAANAIHKQYDKWSDVEKDPKAAMEIFSRSFQKISSDFPDFSSTNPNSLEPKSRVLAFDSSMSFYDMENGQDESEQWAHRCISVIAQSLRKDGESPSGGKLKDRFITQSQNGLSWLFGAGLDWIRDTPPQEICKALHIPSGEMRRVAQLKKFAAALPHQNTMWPNQKFSVFRKKTGGKLGSWISNYWKRLGDLQKYLDKPPKITIPSDLIEKTELFSGNNLSAHELQAAVADLPVKMDEIKTAVEALCGESEYEGSAIANIREMTAYLESLIGEIEIVNNRLEQKQENHELKIKTGTLKKPERVNRIGGGAVDAGEIIREIEESLTTLMSVRREHYQELLGYAETCGNTDPLDNLIVQERAKLTERGRDTSAATENARRLMLHRLAIFANRLSKDTKEKLIAEVKTAFPDEVGNRKNRDANKFFHNRQGAIYVSPYSTRRHHAYKLTPQGLSRDWVQVAESLRKSVEGGLSAHGTPALLRDELLLEGFIFSTRLWCLPDEVPARLCRRIVDLHDNEKLFIPALLKAQLSQGSQIPRNAVLKLFNLYASAINGLLFQATREQFITRVVFSREGTDQLVYVPKQKNWMPPKPYFHGSSPIARALKKDWVVWDDDGRIVRTEETFSRLCKGDINSDEAVAYLTQAPHDWYLESGIDGIGETRCGMTVHTSGAGKATHKGEEHTGLLRLRAPSSRRTVVDRILAAIKQARTHKLQLGDPNLIMDTQYRQTVKLERGLPRISIEKTETTMEAAILMVDKSKADDRLDLFGRIVAIDLGERGIGYAVFDLQDWINAGGTKGLKPMTDPETKQSITGTISAPSIRALIRAVRTHRNRRQPMQKVNLKYSTLLQQRRENVIGDVCNRIDALCEKYGGFPVLESTVGNLESGGKQLSLVYNSVCKMYLYDDTTAARNDKRQHRWAGAKMWTHPWLVKRKHDAKKQVFLEQPDGLYNLFPGAAVSSAGTSQTCHRCERNPIKVLQDLKVSHLDVKDGGLIRLSDDTICLCDSRTGEDKAYKKRLGRQHKRPPLDSPIQAGKRKREDVIKLLRRNLRRPPESLQSPDTTQSRYHCVYTDCDFIGHADANAAINIGVKFLKERVHFQASKAKFDKRNKTG